MRSEPTEDAMVVDLQGSMVRAFVVGLAGVAGSGVVATGLGLLAQTLILWAGI
jgi:hypothetical protein